jgi:hypothetical protein
MSPTAPAPGKPATVKTENGGRTSVPLENLFDDLKDEGPVDVKEEVKKRFLSVKKAGNWDSDGEYTITLHYHSRDSTKSL